MKIGIEMNKIWFLQILMIKWNVYWNQNELIMKYNGPNGIVVILETTNLNGRVLEHEIECFYWLMLEQ